MSARLISEGAFRKMADVVLAASRAEHALVSFSDARDDTLRFANNQVVQNVSVRNRSASIVVASGRQVGRSSTNRLDDAGLCEAVARAEAIAKLAPADPEYLPPLAPQQYPDTNTFRQATADATPMELARRTEPVIKECGERNLVGAGVMTRSVGARCVAASSGLFACETGTEAGFSLTATSRAGAGYSESDSSGWAYNVHRDIDSLGVAERARRAMDKAVNSARPREVPAGHHVVILEPAAVAGILGPLLWAADAKDYYRGNSPLAGRLEQRILDERLTIRSDPAHPDLIGSRFGGDGMASGPVTWVRRGILRTLRYDRFTAQEHNVPPTPPGGGQIAEFEGPRVGSVDELIASTKRGILITNFWYIRHVDPSDLTITGMTRDGTFLVEDGKVVCGLKNFRFHDSPLRAFKTVDAATAPLEAVTLERPKMLLPAVRLPDFYLSSVTRF